MAKSILKKFAKITPSLEFQENLRHLVQVSKIYKFEYRCFYGHQAWRWHKEPRFMCWGPQCGEWMHVHKVPEFPMPTRGGA